MAEIAAPHALDIKAFGPVGSRSRGRRAVHPQRRAGFGGLDVVVNLVPLAVPRLEPAATTADIERIVAQRLLLPFLLSKIAANRMAWC